ncbi:OprO/OprP family phosphate-selective porin [Phenylobacterium sp.]|uniref:OprO/OprP family phosphate-selective porin n=1 Tax=Phenylobacterium sp. TaxID=1871053 RepID=UPI0035B42A94
MSLGEAAIFKRAAWAVAGVLAAGGAAPAAADSLLTWDEAGRQFVSPEGEVSIHPKGRLLLDIGVTGGSSHDERNLSASELRAARLGVDGMVGERLYYTVEGDFSGEAPVLRGTYVAWRDRLAGHDVELTLGNRLSERGLDGSSSSDGTPFMERNTVATAIAPLKGFYGWGAIGKVFGPGWHVAVQAAGHDPANRELARGTQAYLARAHWNPVRGEGGLAHLGVWGFHEDFPSDMASLTRTTTWAGHYNEHLKVSLGALIDPRSSDGYGLELGGVRGPFWSFAEAGRRDVETRCDHVQIDAVSLSAGWMVTGDPTTYAPKLGNVGKIAPLEPVSKGGIGGWEVAVRYQRLDNTDAPQGAWGEETTLGVNWRLEAWMRLMVNVSRWKVVHPAGPYAGADQGEALAGRLQVNF